MESRKFSDLLKAAVGGNNEAMVEILPRYMPLINKQSVINGSLDEDLRQYILLRIIEQTSKFNLPEK